MFRFQIRCEGLITPSTEFIVKLFSPEGVCFFEGTTTQLSNKAYEAFGKEEVLKNRKP